MFLHDIDANFLLMLLLCQTLLKLQKFTAAIRSKKATEQPQESKQQESYRGQVFEKNSDDDNEQDQLDNWFVGKLKCKKHIDQRYRNVDGNTDVTAGRHPEDFSQ
jgi:hypothetical protein